MFGKLFRKPRADFDELASNLYQVLVEEPPSSADPDALGPSELEIEPAQFIEFSQKRTFLLEAMFFCAAITAAGGGKTPLVSSVQKLLEGKWRVRGMRSEVITSMHDACWNEIELLLSSEVVPVSWSKKWLAVFYPDGDFGPHLYSWARQCHQEFTAMKSMFDDYSK